MTPNRVVRRDCRSARRVTHLDVEGGDDRAVEQGGGHGRLGAEHDAEPLAQGDERVVGEVAGAAR